LRQSSDFATNSAIPGCAISGWQPAAAAPLASNADDFINSGVEKLNRACRTPRRCAPTPFCFADETGGEEADVLIVRLGVSALFLSKWEHSDSAFLPRFFLWRFRRILGG